MSLVVIIFSIWLWLYCISLAYRNGEGGFFLLPAFAVARGGGQHPVPMTIETPLESLLLFLYIFMPFSCFQSEADNEKIYTTTATYTNWVPVTDLFKNIGSCDCSFNILLGLVCTSAKKKRIRHFAHFSSTNNSPL